MTAPRKLTARRAFLAAVMLAGCSTGPTHVASIDIRQQIAVASFSQAVAGAGLPSGWEPWIIDPRKPPTRYALS
jgi:hypothetical protein